MTTAATESPPDRTDKPNGTNGAAPAAQIQDARLEQIVRSPFNREVETKGPEWEEFVASIKKHGVIQPGLARPLTVDLGAVKKGAPRLELVIGERRWLGSEEAGKETMPLMVRQLTDVEAIELQTIENDKRKDLNPLQEAVKYQQLITAYEKEPGMTREKAIARLCEKLSKGKSTVYEALRLLQLPAPVQKAVNAGTLPSSHAGLIAKLPPEFQADYARAIAPGKKLSYKEEEALENVTGYDCQRDEESGLVAFRDAKEVIDSALRDIEKSQVYEKTAAEFRKKGGLALTLAEARAAKTDEYVEPGDYSNEYRSYVRDLVKGVKELPEMIMRPRQHDLAKPEMVYRKTELLAALKKAGVKPKTYGGGGGRSMADYNRRERERQRIAKAVLKAVADPIRAAAAKRNAKIPWALFIAAAAGGQAVHVCRHRGWKADWQSGEKVLADHLAKMPANQMPGVMAEVLLAKLTTEHNGSYQPAVVELGTFYGVDVKAIAKEARARLAPPELKKKAKVKAKVQTAGKGDKTKRPNKTKKKAKFKSGIRLTADGPSETSGGAEGALKARWAARWAARRSS